MYAFHSESTLYICLDVKELLARSRTSCSHGILGLRSSFSQIPTQNFTTLSISDMAPSYSVLSSILLKKLLWSLSKMLLSIILLPHSIIFTSFTRLYLSLSIHTSLCFVRTDVISSVSFSVSLSCLSIFFSFGVSFLHCFLSYISLLVLAINCLSCFISAFNFPSLLFPFCNLLLVCFFFSFRSMPIFFSIAFPIA